ncbi:hypothetical protein TNCV_3469941 [Trichonephila clavipes]|nr:hypothetical protein TNCV_3469941 [Trichonephila clavipes]
MKDIQIKIGYMYLLMAMPQLPLVGLELSPTLLILKNLLVPDSEAAIKTVSDYNLFPSKLEFECKQLLSTHFFASEERSFSNGSHLIAAFMEMNKSTSPPYLPMSLRSAKRLLRDKFRQKRISTLTDQGCWQILVLSA